jgi:hypothetical protein
MLKRIQWRVVDLERITVRAFIWAVLLVLLLRFVIDSHTINNDVALYLNTGQLILHGKWPYVDFIDVNPPLIMYLNVVPAAVARVLPVSPVVVCNVMVWSLVAGSTFAIRSLLRLRSTWSVHSETLVLIAWLSVNAMIASFVEWGEREHLFMLLYVPFFLLRTLDAERTRVPRGARAILGSMAALGALLKPGFLVLVAVPELYWFFRRQTRPLRTVETTAFAGVSVAYAVHFLLLPTSVRHALFAQWLPLVSRYYNDVYASPWRNMVYRQWVIFLVFLLVAAVPAVARYKVGRERLPLDDLFIPLVLLSVASLAYYFQQHKGWMYQVIPFQLFAALTLAVALGNLWGRAQTWVDRRGWRELRVAGTISMIALVALVVAVREVRPAVRVATSHTTGLLPYVITKYSRPGDRVLFVATSVVPAYPTLVQMDRQPGSRFLWMFPIALYEAHRAPSRWYRTYAQLDGAERHFVDAVEQDILTLKPRLIFVSLSCQGCPRGFSLSRYIESTGIRTTAMASYSTVTVDGLQFFTRNQRRPPSRLPTAP